MIKLMSLAIIFVFLNMPGPVYSTEFSKVGDINRTLSADEKFGGCMINLSVPIENGCPDNWVSLDCKGIYISSEAGERNYASALMAALLKKSVMVVVDNAKKHNNFCVATRIDILL